MPSHTENWYIREDKKGDHPKTELGKRVIPANSEIKESEIIESYDSKSDKPETAGRIQHAAEVLGKVRSEIADTEGYQVQRFEDINYNISQAAKHLGLKSPQEQGKEQGREELVSAIVAEYGKGK